MGHTRDIRGVFMGYTYVSGMCRVCIGYVSGTCRRGLGAWGGLWMTQKKEGGINDNIDNLRPNQ